MNRAIRAERKKLKLCAEITGEAPRIERELARVAGKRYSRASGEGSGLGSDNVVRRACRVISGSAMLPNPIRQSGLDNIVQSAHRARHLSRSPIFSVSSKQFQ